MKSILHCYSLLLSVPLLLAAQAGDELRLVWSDDFEKAGAPDPAKWTYEKGFVRNQELQFYTDNRRENARVENGCLIIEARHETVANPSYKEGSTNWMTNRKEAQYTSASVITKGRKTFRYGKIEVRAKLPAGKGIWPAIWMIGANRGGRWPVCGEIDIMEFVSHDPGTVYGTIHFAKPGGTQHQQVSGNTKSDSLHTEFHVYGLEWDETKLSFLFDGKAYKTIELDVAGPGANNPFRQSDTFYLLLNVAVGGSWGKEPDPKVYPQRFEIDWVKAWERQ